MKIHEYQAKELFKRFHIPVPEGAMAESPEAARRIAAELGREQMVVKAQIHAGGRGKGGGVKVVRGPDEVFTAAGGILGMNLVTPQTGPSGQKVRKILVEEARPYQTEAYLGLTLDRNLSRLVMMVSPAGGMDIEEVAEKHPDLIFKEVIDPRFGLLTFQSRNLAGRLGWTGAKLRSGTALFENLYRLFMALDASLVEINPLVVTVDDQILALDAKISFDDNALYRHPEISELEDSFEMDPLELEATRQHLNYIRLDGNIGAMVNGAGLAMATMDIIKQAGAAPANFLDAGGSANADRVARGFQIILSDKRVEAVLINIFGGILRCDVFAQGVIEAAKKAEVKVPVIIRLEGTNKKEGQRLLDQSGLEFSVARDLKDAADKVAALAGGKK